MTGNISFSKGMLRVCREALVEREAPSTRQVIAAVVCGVCRENDSQYTCPRCNCRYCSLGCFQKHGARCTESFYKEQVCQCVSEGECVLAVCPPNTTPIPSFTECCAHHPVLPRFVNIHNASPHTRLYGLRAPHADAHFRACIQTRQEYACTHERMHARTD